MQSRSHMSCSTTILDWALMCTWPSSINNTMALAWPSLGWLAHSTLPLVFDWIHIIAQLTLGVCSVLSNWTGFWMYRLVI